MKTINITVSGTNFTPYSALDLYDTIDGGYVLDPLAFPDSFSYSTSAVGIINSVGYTLKNFSISSVNTFPQGIFLKSDGTKAYVLELLDDRIYEYSLPKPWDLYYGVPTGNIYNISEENTPTMFFFKSDGTRLYVAGDVQDTIYQYNFGTAWNLATITYSTKSFSIASQDIQPRGLYIRPDGLRAYIIGLNTKRIYEYTLSVAWDISTASYSTRSVSVSDHEESPQGVFFKSDGTKVYFVGNEKNRIYEYKLTTPWNISTAVYEENYFSLSAEDNFITDLHFKPDGEYFYVVGNQNDLVYQYELKKDWAVETIYADSVTESISGGELKVIYNDLGNFKFEFNGDFIFCDSDIIFDFSKFDKSRSEIISLIFDPNNKTEVKKFTSKISGNSVIPPILSAVESIFYPSETFYTFYNPTFKLSFADGMVQNITYPLTVIQCGIFESYKDKYVIESLPEYKKLTNIVLFINDIKKDNIIISDINTRLPFILSANIIEDDIELPNVIRPIPMLSTFFSLIDAAVPLPPTNENPVLPPFPKYIYSSDQSIIIVPRNAEFLENDKFGTANASILLSGTGGVPYFEGNGIVITIFVA
jgi:DNA-binding beta-propeller fold protein YncE